MISNPGDIYPWLICDTKCENSQGGTPIIDTLELDEWYNHCHFPPHINNRCNRLFIYEDWDYEVPHSILASFIEFHCKSSIDTWMVEW